MDSPAASFLDAAQAAQAGAGIIAARHRGDRATADALLSGLTDDRKADGFLFLADLAVTLLAGREGRSVDDVTADLSQQIASQIASI
jgi:hypothetical protein